MVYAQVSKTCGTKIPWRFDSSPRHYLYLVFEVTTEEFDPVASKVKRNTP